MRKVFEPGELEFADSRGDPTRVTEIQRKVGELLSANRQRRDGLLQEVQAEGAWAVPALVNASLVWMNRLEDAQSQRILSDLMASLAKDNLAAMDLIFRAGVLEAPFDVPRSIARRALEKLDWQPSDVSVQKELLPKIKECEQVEDIQAALDLYGLLLSRSNPEDLPQAQAQCGKWLKRSFQQAGELLAMIIRQFPAQVESILVDTILGARDDFRSKTVADLLLESLRPIPSRWLQEDVLLRVSTQVLTRMKMHRHTAIEYLWRYAVADYKRFSSQSWLSLMEGMRDRLDQEGSEPSYRYWFRALGEAGEVSYIAKQASDSSGLWAEEAVVQLLFQNRDNQAQRALHDLKISNPNRYEEAKQKYDGITSGRGKDEGPVSSGSGPVVPSAGSNPTSRSK